MKLISLFFSTVLHCIVFILLSNMPSVSHGKNAPHVASVSSPMSVPVVIDEKIKPIHLYPENKKIIASPEVYCLAECVYFEARSQSDKGRLAVIDVILSRVRSTKFPDTVCSVIHEKGQFSWYWDNKPDTINETDLFLEIYNLAASVLQGKTAHDITDNATHYYADYIAPPYWTKNMIRTAKIERHIFYR